MKLRETPRKKIPNNSCKGKNLKVKRGDIFLINCNNIDCFGRKETLGIIIQNNKGNHFSPCTIVAFSTFKKELHKSDMSFDIENITKVDKSRLLKKVGGFSSLKMHFIDKALIMNLTTIKEESIAI
ncbi:type II toxin-antitoxin system PemK/MazF family toxin [Ornithinibacillus halophilus]|uniref:mRNA-degrading endonuclease, toxin component of the MazEF toxin-antitoxin module n=1 Tax=Ornithinibacillus halophilus TaxID=930117 RepID=A0A1M5G299_9BACI|nr:type II toxin-antitoxin system PemK/MazF family toxin [Ornithinibacillus halophilus]SHF97853.1 mRNA-degrading endonuclease, toxin component of the MazEF toxin-antitoxin module [Ornithinibacillus halophilus]